MSASRTRADERADAADSQAADSRAPDTGAREQCDLIMKGGITSGIVYPRAVATLRTRYDFRSIGGASAGAIGAALTAAAQYAEHRRRRDPAAAGGFDQMERTSAEIARPGVLAGLFQPSRGSAWVYRLFFGLQGARGLWTKAWVVLRAVVRYFSPQVVVTAGIAFGSLTGVLYGFDGAFGRPTWYGSLLLVVVVGITSLLGLVGAMLVRILRTVRGLPATFYGICLGMPDRPGAATAGPGGPAALTPWLHRHIQLCAGRGEGDDPLTFADLARAEVENERVRLEMMTTDLSTARPLSLPFSDQSFLYAPAEFARLFPPDVLTYLEKVSTPVAVPEAPGVPAELRAFPTQDLPVVVATRMSLSFPVLISAVPLWVRGLGDAGPVRHWFSDGGIASNFPMHFFDAWLPARPTFGLDLVPAPRGEAGQRERPHRHRPSGAPEAKPRTAAAPSAVVAAAAAGGGGAGGGRRAAAARAGGYAAPGGRAARGGGGGGGRRRSAGAARRPDQQHRRLPAPDPGHDAELAGHDAG
ncbi:patatin-like phospholipase family protein [Frankia sp. CNm7]|uniref:patatin-like phospholipase family protein n=1 Tax=Frankia nepalensis TaxID=1836974 RepID=UPI0019315451|nr:patatin-like phospholipase family protein [Frankia nepalensis]MBL7518514.1 patatin-like phospholipase family protein [Frankia nepalensis]